MSKAKTSYLAEAPDPIVGSTIAGRYQVMKKLGEGGMGSVYLALHTVLEKQVALKILHGEFARKPDLVERFMQEAKAASRIRHENVIDISDFGATPDGLVFFAMELLKGHDLHDEITRAKLAGKLLPWSRSKKIFLQICSALAAAHARGIIHRDLKPENVYLVEFLDDPDFVKLLDFGIAKMTDVSGNAEEGARKLTKTGMLFGTPEYMSPEQARGEKVDHRVDIYAMGCILFQLVSNSVPFQADNFMGVLSQHLTAEPPQIAPEVFDQIGAPRALSDVIDKALVKDPNDRYQTIDELANAVREVCGDAPPADRSIKMRAASVDAPATTTRQRPPTGQVPPASASSTTSMRSEKNTGRVKTQWTGNLTVPEVAVDAPARAPTSKLPLLIGAGVLVAGGVAVAAMVLGGGGGGGGGGTQAPVAAGSGSAAATGSGSGSAQAAGVATTTPPKQPELPAIVAITFDTTPKGALIVDASDPAVTYGRTPTTFNIPGSSSPRRFKFVLKGYGDNVVELIPNRASIDFSKDLVKAGKPDVVTTLPDLGKPADTSGGGPRPDTTATGSAAAATGTTTAPDIKADPTKAPDPRPDTTAKPDTTPTDPKPDTTAKPDVPTPDPTPKPDGSGAKKPDCPDDEVPCLKSFP